MNISLEAYLSKVVVGFVFAACLAVSLAIVNYFATFDPEADPFQNVRCSTNMAIKPHQTNPVDRSLLANLQIIKHKLRIKSKAPEWLRVQGKVPCRCC